MSINPQEKKHKKIFFGVVDKLMNYQKNINTNIDEKKKNKRGVIW
jgi:hypothetical protein